MKRRCLASLWRVAVALPLVFALGLRGEDAPTSAPPPAAAVQAPAAPAAPEPAKAAKADVSATPAPTAPEATEKGQAAGDTELRRLDHQSPPSAQAERRAQRKATRARRAARQSHSQDVQFFHDVTVAEGETVGQAVAIKGDILIDGHASDQSVCILGDTTINGSVGDQAVTVLGGMTVNGSVGDQAVVVGGDAVINGRVGGQLVVVGGGAKLGPAAVVNGEIVVVGGTLQRSPGAVVRGDVQQVSLPPVSGLLGWVRSALFKGRLLSFAGNAVWAWGVALGFLLLYVFLALVFRRGVEKCAETLEQKPGYTILAALLTMLALPLLFLLLAITGLGVVVVPFLAVGLFVCRLFGRAAMLAWFGRRITGRAGGAFAHPAMAVLVGGVLVALLYLIPVVALIVHVVIGVLGLGMVIYALILSMRRNGTKTAAPAAVAPAPVAAMAAVPPGVPTAGGTAPVETAPAAGGFAEMPDAAVPPIVPAVPTAPPPRTSPPATPAATLPRAGFWIRLAASFLDAILVGLAVAFVGLSGWFLLIFTVYCLVLWALKGTTVGGVICGLKIVRLDDRKVDWGVALVRLLASFLSLAVVGLGFIWVAFDDDAQSWHDKIAGTTIVKMPKGVSLI